MPRAPGSEKEDRSHISDSTSRRKRRRTFANLRVEFHYSWGGNFKYVFLVAAIVFSVQSMQVNRCDDCNDKTCLPIHQELPILVTVRIRSKEFAGFQLANVIITGIRHRTDCATMSQSLDS